MDQSKALSIVEQHRQSNDLVLVKPEDLQTQRMFVPQVTVIHATQADFHNIPSAGLMPKSYHTDRIGEAAGVEFIAEHCGTRKDGEYVWVGFAQGRRRMPDGTYRTSSKQEYEWDAELRSELDAKGDNRKREKLMLEYRKFGRQRASTGARLRVIRELTGIPATFSPQDIQRALVVSRIAVNTDELLDNPDTRRMAVQAAVNGSAEVYGPRDVSPEPVRIEAPEDDADPFDTPPESTEQQLSPTDEARIELERWKETGLIARNREAVALIDQALANPDTDLDELQALIVRCESYEAKHSGGAA